VTDDPRSEQKIPERVLGDEWDGWQGEETPIGRYCGKFLFIFFFGLASSLVILALHFFWYMIKLRLDFWFGIFGWQQNIFNFIIAACYLLFITDILLALYGKPLLPAHWRILFFIKPVHKIALLLSQIFRIPKDCIYHAFIDFSNSLMSVFSRKIPAEKILVLLPRCLKKENKEQAASLCRILGVYCHTASGGEDARKKIRRLRPYAVIGIACERDLLSGINDVPVPVSVYGIANQRPEGPCINTVLDISVLKKILCAIIPEKQPAIQEHISIN